MASSVQAPSQDPKSLISSDLFSLLTSRLASEREIDMEYAERIMVQTLGFLQVCAQNPGERLAPPFEVDWGWHTFILHTKAYSFFCLDVAHRFLHHEPADGMDDGGEAIQRTAALMREAGLPVDENMWSPAGTGCNNACHLDCNSVL